MITQGTILVAAEELRQGAEELRSATAEANHAADQLATQLARHWNST
jgi:hypothetical protein